MMDGGRKTLILLTLCALVGTNALQQLITFLDISVSVPSTHIGDTEIVSARLSLSAAHPFRCTFVAQKNQTKCVNSTDPLCPSLILPPALNVLVYVRDSKGKIGSYSTSINGSMELTVHVDLTVTVTPQRVNDGSDAINFLLDITHNNDNTRWGSFRSIPEPTKYTFNGEFTTTFTGEETGQGDGVPALRSVPLCALLLLALLPVLFLK